jgi:hypothetical protein
MRPAFLSSDQVNELTAGKAVIELQIYGFGLVTVDRNVPCGHCGKPGHVQLPADVTGCMHCQHMDLSRSVLQYEDAETFRKILVEIPAMVEKAIAHVNDRYYAKPKRRR